ncbi:hypothetical protein DM02DRAFT_647729 [Periconia macrospinosa]|uniref:RING-type domain-containing protein n=1 Tax=Periconia macrospinosa TaxID=97972 RepID=A0A2V1EFT9_9PLEO|nr:hypothetical protein DM02DRAFT_647729 [Periconia macrospinosa]
MSWHSAEDRTPESGVQGTVLSSAEDEGQHGPQEVRQAASSSNQEISSSDNVQTQSRSTQGIIMLVEPSPLHQPPTYLPPAPDCPICLQPQATNDNDPSITSCFSCKNWCHYSCLNEWMNMSAEGPCPFCRIPIGLLRHLPRFRQAPGAQGLDEWQDRWWLKENGHWRYWVRKNDDWREYTLETLRAERRGHEINEQGARDTASADTAANHGSWWRVWRWWG